MWDFRGRSPPNFDSGRLPPRRARPETYCGRFAPRSVGGESFPSASPLRQSATKGVSADRPSAGGPAEVAAPTGAPATGSEKVLARLTPPPVASGCFESSLTPRSASSRRFPGRPTLGRCAPGGSRASRPDVRLRESMRRRARIGRGRDLKERRGGCEAGADRIAGNGPPSLARLGARCREQG